MATKYIDQHGNPIEVEKDKSGTLWHEMKPFVKFGLKTLGIMAGALIAIVKAIPKPGGDEKPKPNGKVIKI